MQRGSSAPGRNSTGAQTSSPHARAHHHHRRRRTLRPARPVRRGHPAPAAARCWSRRASPPPCRCSPRATRSRRSPTRRRTSAARIFGAVRDLPTDDANIRVVSDIFARLDARAAVPGVLAACESFRPDLVVHEVREFAGALVAAHTGVPVVSVGIGLARVERLVKPATEAALDDVRRDLGLHAGDSAAYFTLTPPLLEDPAAPGPEGAPRFRERDAGVTAPLPDWWEGARGPLVYLTFGSVAPQMDFFPGLYQRRDRRARAAAGARARDDRARPRPGRPRAAAAARSRRALDPAGRRAPARRRDGLPRRLRHAARRAGGGRADGGAPALRRPALQRRTRRAAGRRAWSSGRARRASLASPTPCARCSPTSASPRAPRRWPTTSAPCPPSTTAAEILRELAAR